MVDTHEPATPARRRRSDARRSIDAILNAARIVFGERFDASMEEIAAAADVTRQTVYAHFPSRDALVAALIEAAAAEYLGALDAAGLDTAPPAEALAQFHHIGWRLIRRYPLLLNHTATRIRPNNDPHELVPPRLERLIRRGQRTGDFDPSLDAAWLVAAVIGLQHAAAAEVADGRLTAGKAAALCLESTLRVCGSSGGPSARR
jgi:AcrR family transcriptional regulator